jgi:hypothetical protein
MVGSWFPLRPDMMECAEFRKLTPREKVVLLDMLSEINYRNFSREGHRIRGFIKADSKWAKELGLSLSKFRQARRKFGKWEWVDFKPGKYAGGPPSERKRLATEYYSAKWSWPKRGLPLVTFDRHTWTELKRALMQGSFTHTDLVVCAFVCYFWERLGGRVKNSFCVEKGQFRRAANLRPPRVNESLGRLRKMKSCKGVRLLEYADGQHDFRIAQWAPTYNPDAELLSPEEKDIYELYLREGRI